MEKQLSMTVQINREWLSLIRWRVMFQIPTAYTYSTERDENVDVPNDLRKQAKEMFSVVRKEDDEPVDYMEEYNQQLQFIKTAIKEEKLTASQSLISLKDGKFSILFSFRSSDKSNYENFKQSCLNTKFVQLVTK